MEKLCGELAKGIVPFRSYRTLDSARPAKDHGEEEKESAPLPHRDRKSDGAARFIHG